MTGAVLERPPIRVEVYPRRVWDWLDLFDAGPGPAIALDGMVMGGPAYDEKLQIVNFDHHDGVVREATMSTAMQVYFAIKGGLMQRFTTPTVYINDVDQDTALAVWLLANHHLFERTKSVPAISRLLALSDRLDITGGAFPMDLRDTLLAEHNWVFEPYTGLRTSGALSTASAEVMRDCLEATLGRLDKFLMGEPGQVELDTRHTILDRLDKPACWFVDEIGGNHARYALYGQGMPAFVSIVARRPDGRTVYSLGRRSRYIDFPLPAIYDALNKAEGGRPAGTLPAVCWGGSDIIGGSPRQSGSALTWQQIRDVIQEVGRA